MSLKLKVYQVCKVYPDVTSFIGIGFLGKIMSFDSKFRPKNLKNYDFGLEIKESPWSKGDLEGLSQVDIGK